MILVTIKKLNDLQLTVLLPAEGIIRQPYSMSFQDLLHYIASAAMPPLRIRNVFRHRFYFRYGIFRTTRQATFTHYCYIGHIIPHIQDFIISKYRLGQETANMQWPEWIYGAFVPIGAAFAAIAFFQTMLVMCKEYKEQEGKK